VLRDIERPRVSITARFGNFVFTPLQYEVVSLLIFVFWAVLVAFANAVYDFWGVKYNFFWGGFRCSSCLTLSFPCSSLLGRFQTYISPTGVFNQLYLIFWVLFFSQTFANVLSHLHCYVELHALRESMRYMFPQYHLTYFDVRLNARYATADIWEATAEHHQGACPWYIGDDRQRNRPLNVAQYWVAWDPDAMVFLPKYHPLNDCWVSVSPAHQRIVYYIPDALGRGRYARLSNFLPLLKSYWRSPGYCTSACLHRCSIR
jgi:hypothetical protein